MRKIAIAISCAVALGACGGSDDGDAGNDNPAFGPAAVGELCSAQGVLGCAGDIWVECDLDNSGNLTWFGISDCSGAGKICVESGGTTGCQDDPNAVEPPPPACDMSGHVAGAQLAFFDSDLFGHYRIDSYELDATQQNVVTMLVLFAMPGTPLNVEQSFTGQNSKIETCGTCLVGMDANNKTYMAHTGGVTFSALGDVGEQVVASLSPGVKLREVEMSNTTASVPDGDEWCIDNLTISAPIFRFACDFLELEDNQTRCFTDDQMATCVPADDPTRGFSQLFPGDMCSPETTCVDSDPVGEAVCQ